MKSEIKTSFEDDSLRRILFTTPGSGGRRGGGRSGGSQEKNAFKAVYASAEIRETSSGIGAFLLAVQMANTQRNGIELYAGKATAAGITPSKAFYINTNSPPLSYCVAMSLLQKPPHYREVHLNSCPAFVSRGT
jgi:hypothetical protein